jgi:hypothetical protein
VFLPCLWYTFNGRIELIFKISKISITPAMGFSLAFTSVDADRSEDIKPTKYTFRALHVFSVVRRFLLP